MICSFVAQLLIKLHFDIYIVCIFLKNIKIIYTVQPLFPFTFISLQHIFVRLGELLLL